MTRKLRIAKGFSNKCDKSFGAAFVMALAVVVLVSTSYADDAAVLPKGVFRATLDGNFYLPIHSRYNPKGKVEDLAVDFNATLDSNVFPALAPLNPFVGGLASIGDSIVSFEYNVQTLDMGLQYGLTDSLTVGVKVPYWWFHNKVKARLDSGPGSSANVGKNPFFLCGSPICPLFVPLTSPLTTEDVRKLLGKGLDVDGDGVIDIPGFNYKRFQSWKANGLSDIEAGFRYQYFKSDLWFLAFTGGVRFPTGRVDDPDNLTDYGFGNGAWALLFQFNHDFVVSNLWKAKKDTVDTKAIAGVGDLVLNGTFRYDLILPDHEKKRVTSDVNNPITTNKENVKRDLGDVFEFEASAKYGLFKGLTVGGLYKYTFSLEDKISGNMGFAYRSLEEETKIRSHIYTVGISYTTIPLYLEKQFPLPLTATFSYRNRFAGSNNMLRSQYVGFGLHVYF